MEEIILWREIDFSVTWKLANDAHIRDASTIFARINYKVEVYACYILK